jgi:uncharacterized damage-inducible protein DinB
MNAAQYFDHWHKVWRDLMRGISMLRDEHLDFLPAEVYGRSIGDILLHLINLEEGWIHFVIRRDLDQWPSESKPGLNTVDALRQEMERVHEKTFDILTDIPADDFNRIVQVPGDGTPKLGWILWHVLEQEIHHRGELFLCLSLLGFDRPKTDRPG